mgnify:FL=1
MLLALGQTGWEAELVASLVTETPAADVRRCVDVTALLSHAVSTPTRIVVVDADFPRIDAVVIAKLMEVSTVVIGVAADAEGAQRLDRWGVEHIVSISSADVTQVVERIRELWVATDDATESSGTDTAVTPDVAARRAIGRADVSAGRLIAVWGPPGAPGRTTIALAISQLLAEHGAEVLLVDADTSAAGIGAALCLESDGSGIIAANHHAQRGDLDAPGLARLARSVGDGMRVLTGVTHVSRRIELRAAPMARLWQVAVDLVESCVVDIGGCVDDGSLALDGDVGDFGLTSSGHSAAATALAAADDLVVVSSCEPANVARLLSNVSAIRSLAPSARMHVVINRVRTPIVRNEAAAEELREFVAMHIDAAHVLLVAEDRTTMDAATARGLTPLEQNRKCAFIRDLVPLVRELSSPVVASR